MVTVLKCYNTGRILKAGALGSILKPKGLSADVLKTHVTTGAVTAALTNAQGRLELIARIFADTGVKNLFKQIYNLIQRYEDRKKVVRLNNEYFEICIQVVGEKT